MSGRIHWFRSRIGAAVCLLMAIVFIAIFFALARGHRPQQLSPLPSRDDYSRSDAWVALGGAWTATPAEVQNNSEERGDKLMTHLGNWDDYQVQADVKVADPYGEAGLIIRSNGEEEGVDAYHGYFAGIRLMDDSVEFGRTDFGWLPLLHKGFPAIGDLQGWIHLRVVAVGCRFGVAVTLPDGRTTSSVVEDTDCIKSGRFGLRSSLTSAIWRNLKVARATVDDLNALDTPTTPTDLNDVILAEPFDTAQLKHYLASVHNEAKKHEVQPGVVQISSFPLSPGRHPDVTVEGVVISTAPLVDIQDETGVLIIPHLNPNTPIKLGDFVEAHGTVVSDRFRSRLEDAQIHVLWSDTPIPPLFVTASQLTGGTYRGRSIELEGVLISANARPGGYDLVLQDGNQFFRATGPRDFRLDPTKLQPGSRLRLKGIATSLPEFTNDIYPFTVITERVDIVSAPPWWSPKHIVLLCLTCIALLLSTQLVLHRLQRWHLRSLLHEREQLAFEMHDTLAQSFTGIAYQLQAASIERRGADRVQTHIQNALQMVHISHKEASRTIAALRPQYTDAAGILNSLKEAAERLSDGSHLRITVTISGRSTQLPLEVTDALFRIGQEAVSNAIQHAGCSELNLALRPSKREVQLSIQDNGRGFSEQEVSGGLGIAGMRSRAAKIRGRFDLQSAASAGTTVTVTASLPLARGLFYRMRAMLRRDSASVSLQ
jgi:two-component sensor histidine kinase